LETKINNIINGSIPLNNVIINGEMTVNGSIRVSGPRGKLLKLNSTIVGDQTALISFENLGKEIPDFKVFGVDGNGARFSGTGWSDW
jgi:hypothetical protein